MEYQGTPIGSSNQGMKNTTDPQSQTNSKTEHPGAIASDSLAAESSRNKGGFSSNPDSEPLSVAGGQSTFANTDTSGAVTLPPAPNAQARDDLQNDGQDTNYPDALGGQGKGEGGGPTYYSTSGGNKKQGEDSTKEKAPFGTSDTDGSSHGVSGADAAKKAAAAAPDTSSSSSHPGSTSNSGADQPSGSSSADSSSVPTAPGYVTSVVSAPNLSGKPHGKNITEGGFDVDDKKNASFNSDIGSSDDPGRVAEENMQKISQSASGGTGPREGVKGEEGGAYGTLSGDQSL